MLTDDVPEETGSVIDDDMTSHDYERTDTPPLNREPAFATTPSVKSTGSATSNPYTVAATPSESARKVIKPKVVRPGTITEEANEHMQISELEASKLQHDISTTSSPGSSNHVSFAKTVYTPPRETSTASRPVQPPTVKRHFTLSAGYYIAIGGSTVNVADLEQYPDSRLRSVRGLTIGHPTHGKVQFLDDVDMDHGIDFARIVSISNKAIEVYPEGYENKPPVGEELNVRARVTLENVIPIDKMTKLPLTDENELEAFAKKVKSKTEKDGAKFISYDTATGTWVFEVQHFSKYGLESDDEDEENADASNLKQPAKPAANIPLKLSTAMVQKATGSHDSRAKQPTTEPSMSGDDENIEPEPKIALRTRFAPPPVSEEIKSTGLNSLQPQLVNAAEKSDSQPGLHRTHFTSMRSSLFDDHIARMEDDLDESDMSMTGLAAASKAFAKPLEQTTPRNRFSKPISEMDDSSDNLADVTPPPTTPGAFKQPTAVYFSPLGATPVSRKIGNFPVPTVQSKSALTQAVFENMPSVSRTPIRDIPKPFVVDVEQHSQSTFDAGLMLGFSCRVGWGPHGQVLIPSSGSSTLKVVQLEVSPYFPTPKTAEDVANASRQLLGPLQEQLKASTIDATPESPFSVGLRHPPADLAGSLGLVRRVLASLETSSKLLANNGNDVDVRNPLFHIRFAVIVWNLIDALWCAPPADIANSDYSVQQFHKGRVTQWLQACFRELPVKAVTKADGKNASDDEAELAALFHHLSCNNYAEAVRIAIEKKV